MNVVSILGDISQAEKQWKLQFHEWSTKYIVDWKHQYDFFVKNQNRKCNPRTYTYTDDET